MNIPFNVGNWNRCEFHSPREDSLEVPAETCATKCSIKEHPSIGFLDALSALVICILKILNVLSQQAEHRTWQNKL
jgi:hypothetical protein